MYHKQYKALGSLLTMDFVVCRVVAGWLVSWPVGTCGCDFYAYSHPAVQCISLSEGHQ